MTFILVPHDSNRFQQFKMIIHWVGLQRYIYYGNLDKLANIADPESKIFFINKNEGNANFIGALMFLYEKNKLEPEKSMYHVLYLILNKFSTSEFFTTVFDFAIRLQLPYEKNWVVLYDEYIEYLLSTSSTKTSFKHVDKWLVSITFSNQISQNIKAQ